MRSINKRGVILFLLLLGAGSVRAATPSLTVGAASGQAGTVVNLPVTYDPGTNSVNSIVFNITLSSLTLVSFDTGTVVTAAGDTISSHLNGSAWTFFIAGINLNSIAAGTLMTAHMMIAPAAPAGNLGVPASNVSFSDLNGSDIPPGTITGGTVTVTSASTPQISLSKTVNKSSANSGDILTYTIAYQNVGTATASNVLIKDVVPTGATLVANSQGSGTVAGGVITWTIGTVNAGASGTVGFQAQAQ